MMDDESMYITDKAFGRYYTFEQPSLSIDVSHGDSFFYGRVIICENGEEIGTLTPERFCEVLKEAVQNET